MSDTPLVSIVTPAWNEERYLRQALDSVQAQTYPHWEHLIADDGSTDGTASVVHEYMQRDPRVRYLHQPNAGVAAARNLALHHASGQVVAFLDADDLWLPEKLEVSVAEFLRAGQDLLFTDAFLFEGDAAPAGIKGLKRMKVLARTYQGEHGLNSFLTGNRVPLLTALVRREALMAIGGIQSLRIGEDYATWLEMLYAGFTLRSIDRPLSLYRLRPGSLSAGDRKMVKQVLEIIRTLSVRHPDRIDYRKPVSKWLERLVKGVLRADELEYLEEQLGYWGLMSQRMRLLLDRAEQMPFDKLKKRIIRRL